MSSSEDITVTFVCPEVTSLFKSTNGAQDTAPRYSPFVQRDLDILKRNFIVKVANFSGVRSYHRFLPELIRHICASDISVSRFGDIYAFLAVALCRFLGKRSIIIIGGFDAWLTTVPPLKKRYMRWTYRNADLLLVVDGSLKPDVMKNYGISGSNITTMHNAHDASKWQVSGEKEDNTVMMVANLRDSNIVIKGIDAFVGAARLLPDVKFSLVGAFMGNAVDTLRETLPDNVELTGFVPNHELPDRYGRTKVYCQLSKYEGLPNALCEAMLCGCVPVGTPVYGIPTVMGDTGVYVPYGDAEKTADGIRKALRMDGRKARERIIRTFPLEKRERTLTTIIRKLVS